MSALSGAIAFGLAIVFMIIGLIGVIVPILPGTLLIWLTAVVYALVPGGIETLGWGPLFFISIIGITTGTADLWLPYLGAKAKGASKRAMFAGTIGAVLGTIFIPIPLIGTIIGYALGILLGEYQKYRDWEKAYRASLGGVAGWGVATVIQFGGGLLILLIFAIAVLV